MRLSLMCRAERGWLRLIASGLLVAVVMVRPVMAELSVTPSFYTEAYSDDNRRIRPQGGSTAYATVTDGDLEAVFARPTYSVSLTPRARFSRYTEFPELNSEDWFVNLDGLKVLERHQFTVGFEFERESTATTELEDSGIILDISQTRTMLAGNLGWTYEINERLSAGAFGGVSDVSFEKTSQLTRIDYDTANAGLRLTYVASDRTTVTANASISTFNTQQTASETESVAFQIGFEHMFSDTLSGNFAIGHNITRVKSSQTQSVLVSVFPLQFATQQVTQDSRGGGQILNTRVQKTFDRGHLVVTWDRYFSPSSLGVRLKLQETGGRFSYRIRDDLTARAGAWFRERSQEGSGGGLRSLDTMFIRGSVAYQFKRHWTALIEYHFRQQTQPVTNISATSHRIGLELCYAGDPLQYFR